MGEEGRRRSIPVLQQIHCYGKGLNIRKLAIMGVKQEHVRVPDRVVRLRRSIWSAIRDKAIGIAWSEAGASADPGNPAQVVLFLLFLPGSAVPMRMVMRFAGGNEQAFELYRTSFIEGRPTCPVCMGRNLNSDFEEAETLDRAGSVGVVTGCRDVSLRAVEWKLQRFMTLVKTEGGTGE